MNIKKPARKKRKRPIKRVLKSKLLARNFFILLTLIIIIVALGYFFLDKNTFFEESKKQDNILIDDKKYTNEEIMQEVIANIDPKNSKILIENIKKPIQKPEEKFEEKQLKKQIEIIDNKQEAIVEIKKEIFEKVDEIKDDKKELTTPKKEKESKKIEVAEDKKATLKDDEPSVYEIKDEIIESKRTSTDDSKIVTLKDKYKYKQKNKPKLVIVIDDVVSKAQVNKISNIGYPITIAFLPPTAAHKESAKLAKDLSFYMIHFPMQASKAFKNSEADTLNIEDSYEKIEERVKKLRQWYPNAIYTNNHTGSVFTENYEAMNKLFKALKKYNFIFVDSKTTPNSVAKELSVKYNMPYIVRDTFLDNDRNFQAIQNQLKDAIRVAKKEGYAVAIGHPYDVTLKVLKESKHLLNEVELVFLDRLPYL